MNAELMKRIMSEVENSIAFSQEPRLESRNEKSKRLINKYPNEQHHGTKQSGAKQEENG